MKIEELMYKITDLFLKRKYIDGYTIEERYNEVKQVIERFARSEVVRELEEHIKWLQEEGLEESWVIEQLAIRIEELKGESR